MLRISNVSKMLDHIEDLVMHTVFLFEDREQKQTLVQAVVIKDLPWGRGEEKLKKLRTLYYSPYYLFNRADGLFIKNYVPIY